MSRNAAVDFFVFSAEVGLFPEAVRRILEAISQNEVFTPDVWGFNAPFVDRFSSQNIDHLIGGFAGASRWNPLVLRRSNGAFSFVVGRSRNEEGLWNLSGGCEIGYLSNHPDRATSLLALLDQIVEITHAEYAQIANSMTPGARMPFQLETRLPDIPNVVYFGPSCVKEFGADRISACPAHSITWLTDNLVRIEINESLLHPLEKERQNDFRLFFGEQYFMKHPKKRYKSGASPLGK